MQEKVSFKNKNNETLTGMLYSHKKKLPGIIICHGFCSSMDQDFLIPLAEKLSKDFFVLRFNFSGYGTSEGKFEESSFSKQIKDLQSAISFLEDKVTKIGVVGHSMGAAIALLTAGKDNRINCLVEISGRAKFIKMEKGVMSQFLTKKQMKEFKKKGIIKFKDWYDINRIMKKEFFKDDEKHDILSAVENITVPLQIIHGENDRTVNLENAKLIFDKANIPKEIKIIPNGGHNYTKKEAKEKMINSINNWFTKFL